MMRLFLALIALVFAAAPAAALDPFQAAGIDRKPDAQVPWDMPFQDQVGRSVTLGALAQGKPLLLVPVQHQCPNICGITLAGLLQAIAGQRLRPGRDFSLVAFGIDPREKPAAATGDLRRLLGQFPAFPRDAIHGLTGKAADVAAVTQAIGYRYAWDPLLEQYDHVAATAVVSPRGRLTRWLYGIAPDPEDIALAVTEAGQGKVGTWTDQLLLLCYHYDPVTGRYSAAIWTGLRVFAALTLVALLGVIGHAAYRGRRSRP